MPTAPTAREYILEGTKISLDLLTKVAGLIPFPYVGVAVDAVTTLISVSEVQCH
jgi:hypothetical protein